MPRRHRHRCGNAACAKAGRLVCASCEDLGPVEGKRKTCPDCGRLRTEVPSVEMQNPVPCNCGGWYALSADKQPVVAHSAPACDPFGQLVGGEFVARQRAARGGN